MANLYIECSAYVELTRERDPSDEWSGEDTRTDWEFGSISLTKNRYGGMSFPTDFEVAQGDRVFVVIAIWSTGDSFSNSDQGKAEIFGIFDNANAALAFQEKLAASRDYEYDHEKAQNNYPWHGYFERLDEVMTIVRNVEA